MMKYIVPPDPGDCDGCGRQMNSYLAPDGEQTVWCPNCNPVSIEEISKTPKYRCRGCNEIRSGCQGHHSSYDPEVVVPMCSECHVKVHRESSYRPDLTPDLKRKEAEERGLVTVQGLDESYRVDEVEDDC